ncbi:interleukin-8-like [Erpetoichthys calabaricus]|uniref:Interleukin-8-like n=1 Tax=Erpetoichthys calabaricus TaxID=27687 RepID=A0A8C4S9P4_ERPCA|nr:interleukin-8-like [Erpetoichthys calabaricus]
MNSKLLFAMLAVCVILEEGTAIISMGSSLHCVCIKSESRLIPHRILNKVEILPKGPHCNTIQIIAYLKTGEVICLKKKAPWVKMIMKKILENERKK